MTIHQEVPDSGITQDTRIASDVDNVSQDKGLYNALGKELLRRSTAFAAEHLPDSGSDLAQVVVASALAEGGIQPNPLEIVSRVPIRSSSPDTAHAHTTENHMGLSVANKRNEFRVSLDALSAPGPEYGSRRAAFAAALPLALKALFAEEEVRDIRGLIREAAPWSDHESIDSNLWKVIRTLTESGHIMVEPTKAGPGVSPFAFDIGRSSPFDRQISLGDIARAYFESNEPAATKDALHTALRTLLRLEPHTAKAVTLRGADGVACSCLHGLPSRFQAEVESRGVARKTAQNMASALRAMILFGLKRDLFPLVFPKWREGDSFEQLVEQAFPLPEGLADSSKIRFVRHGLRSLFAVLRQDLAIPSVERVTTESVCEAVRLLSAPARTDEYRSVKQLRGLVRQTSGNWEHADLRSVIDGLHATRRSAVLPYLSHPSITGAARSLPKLCALLRVMGFGAEWEEFLTWYQRYSVMSDEGLEALDDEYPTRHPKRELRQSTFDRRSSSIRAYLGVATFALGHQPADLTPEHVFGVLFKAITSKVRATWAEHVGKGVSHGASRGLHTIVYGGGLIAEALYVRSLHARRRACETARPQSGAASIDFDAEERASDRTPRERALFDSYTLARTICAQMEEKRRRQSPTRRGNTVKDLARIVEATPGRLYADVQEHLLSRVAPLTKLNRALLPEERTLVVVTMLHGILLSAGLRIGEPTALRVGIHMPEDWGIGTRIELREVDRKNRKAHPFMFRDPFLPTWFVSFYRFEVWPALLDLGGYTKTPYPWLLLSPTSGRPYADPGESLDGTQRHPYRARDALKPLRNAWRRAVGKACASLGLALPIGPLLVTPHCVRNTIANAVYQAEGAVGAAAFLGDAERTVDGVYGVLDGTKVDSSKYLAR